MAETNPNKGPIYAGDWSACAGKPYQPSNGTEGEMFMHMWCSGCERDRAFREDPDNNDGCEIAANVMAYRVSDPKYPAEWRYDAEGTPKCSAWEPAVRP